jgi:Bacteriodetes cell division protein (FtsL-like)
MARRKNLNYTLQKLASGEFFVRNLQYSVFLVFLGLFYIANAHFSEKTIRKIHAIEQDIRKLNWEFTEIEAKRMEKSRPGALTSLVGPLGLTMDKERIHKIHIPK